MSPTLTYFEEKYRDEMRQLFDTASLSLSEPFQVELSKYRDGSIRYLEFYLQRLTPNSYYENTFLSIGVTSTLQSFFKGFASVDRAYRDALDQVDRMMLDNFFLFKKDPQVESFLQEYIRLEKELFHRNLFSMGSYSSWYSSFEINSHNRYYELHLHQVSFPTTTKLKELKDRISKAITSAVEHIKKQEKFLEEKEKQKTVLSQEAPKIDQGSPTLPAFTVKEQEELLTLKAEREQLFRTLQAL